MLLQLDFSLQTPIYQQIRDQIVQGIAAGELAPGERLPTVRALASECGVNAMTVSKAYQLLKQEGYVHGDRRGGTFVSTPDGASGPDPAAVEALRLRLSELVAGGMSKEDVLALCRRLMNDNPSR
jgi:GntR family transcriptional regulator